MYKALNYILTNNNIVIDLTCIQQDTWFFNQNPPPPGYFAPQGKEL